MTAEVDRVAIVGLSCRVSGASNPSEFWQLISQRRSNVSNDPHYRQLVPIDFSQSDFSEALRYGAYLEDALGFDAPFFRISDAEAENMDPQQRLALELTWDALEDAGIVPQEIAGTSVGLFIGAMRDDFASLMSSRGPTVTQRSALGSLRSVVAGRISHFFGLTGPSLVIDTGQSSSLVAITLAMESLRSGTCDLAIAGGVHLNLDPNAGVSIAGLGVLSPDGVCRPFDKDANGYVRGEGGGFVVLKRFCSELRHGNQIYCEIRGGAVINDGTRPNLAAPTAEGHERLFRAALESAAVDPNEIQFIEAHGTGTRVGDIAEAHSIASVYCGPGRGAGNPLVLGFVKPNVGHLEAAAGVIGVIKTALALKYRILPPSLNFVYPNEALTGHQSTLRVLSASSEWPQPQDRLFAAVSSFGVSGTNAHLILQQPPQPPEPPEPVLPVAPVADGSEPGGEPTLGVWAVSARTSAALAAQAHRLHQHLIDHPGLDITDLAYSLATTRTQHPYRAAITASADHQDPRGELLAALQALALDRPHPGLTRHHYRPHLVGKTVFVFPGQGAQYPGMGIELYQHHRGFAAALDACDQALRPYTGWSVREVIAQEPGAPALDRVDVVQPVLFAVMVSLAEMLSGYGITPDAVIGHSQGEIAAAHIAGALTLTEAAKIVAVRAQTLAALSGTGAMASVLLPVEDLRPRLQPWGTALSIAAINGPTHSIISGDTTAIEQFSAACQRDGIQIRPLAVDYASHCAHVDTLREHLLGELADLHPHPAQIPLYSTVHSQLSAHPLDTTTMDADYWYANLREPVRFHDSVVELLAGGEQVFVELSPHPVLAPAITDTLAAAGGRANSVVITTMHRDRSDLASVAAALGRLHLHGHSPSWRRLYPHAHPVALPTYPFEHRRYWLTPAAAAEVSDPAEGVLWKAVDEGALDTVATTLGLSDTSSLGSVVDGLRQWRKDLGDRSKANKLRYRIGWQTIVPQPFPPTRRRWLVLAFSGQADNDAWIAGLLARYGADIEVLAIDPRDLERDSLTALLSSAATRTRCDGVVSFLALKEQTHPDFPAISAGLIATLCLAQAYGDSDLGVPLWVLTQSAVSVWTGDRAIEPGQAAVWGLGQSVCLEHPQWWGGLIDLPDLATPHHVEVLHTILTCPQTEDQLAIRAQGVSARRLQQAPLPTHRVRCWSASGTALVTGATGRLGQHIVRWLATAGASHLVLLSRSAAHNPQAATLEKELNTAGITTTLASVDMTDRNALADVIASIRSHHGPIRTVVHAAAAIGWHTVSEVGIEEFASNYAKAVGADNLVDLLDDEPPETVILFSSAAATWGGARQGCYAAANAHLDALATRLRARGTTALSVAYGQWADQDAKPDKIVDYFGRIGLNPISPEAALGGLQHSLDADDTLITIADVSWNQFLDVFTARRAHPLLTELTATHPPATAATTTASSQALTARLATQTIEQRLATLTALVTHTTAAVLAHPDPGALDPDRPFKDLGIDSLSALELRNTLSTQTGLTLPATLVFDHPTPTAIATHLVVLLGEGPAPVPRITAVTARTEEPVAVVGMACRLPGGIDSAAALWDVVAGGIDAVGAFPTDRGWDLAGLFDPDPDAVGKTYTRSGAFLPDAAGFDAEFFGISAREALAIDPQQRLLLETCWEAIETAGIDPAGLAGTDTGVFAGTWAQPYGAGGSDSAEGYVMTGAATSVASGRIAYVLGLQGPAITIDTACSSSLVATHLACQSLRNGETGLALAGGVTIMTTPTPFTEFARQRGLAVDGRCKAFAAAADGTGWGEGAAVLVLERLSDAHHNNHPVLAVIAGSAVNQDGASNGLTAPNGPAQQRVISQAVANAGITLDQVDVVEAHGTGTTLGDPVEAGALIATYGAAGDREHPLWVGSIKSNIGHTQAAAGAAGIIKMIAALNHGVLPPTLHIDAPSPHIDWSADTVRLLTEPTPWPETSHRRTAAVSSFGVSGTNAHLILQQPPQPPEPVLPVAPVADGSEPGGEPTLGVWAVSARTSAALAAQAHRLHQHLIDHPGLDITDLAYSLATTRTQHPYRAAITASADHQDPRGELLAALQALALDRPHPGLTRHHYRPHLVGKTVFVFPGQGAQYPGMGIELYQHHRGFAAALDACDQALRPYTGWSVREVIAQEPGAPALDRVDVVQPVLFAVMVSLAEMLSGYGITPDAVIGHSQGEIAAAHIAGALTLTEAAKIVAVRAQTLAALSGTGAMASVLLPVEDLRPRLQPWGTALSIAAINGPTHSIISGDTTAIEQFSAACQRDGIQIRPLAVDYASHCAHVDTLREHLLGELADLHPHPAQIPLYSTVHSQLSAHPLDTTTMDADYWYANLREPVRFHDSVVELLAGGEQVFVELSPHPVLAPAITDTLAAAGGRANSVVITTMHRDRSDLASVAAALGRLHLHGHSPSWRRLYPHAHPVALPTYPFEHRRYWLTPAAAGDVSAAGLGRAEHPLLGAVTELADQDQMVLTGRVSPALQDWLAGHTVAGSVVFPGTGFLEIVLHAGEYARCPVIDELVLHTPLVLSEHAPTDMQILVQPVDPGGRRGFSVHARTSADQGTAGWVLHASGTLSPDQPGAAADLPAAAPLSEVDQDSFYARLATHGLGYRGPFRGVAGIGQDPTDPDVVWAHVGLPADTDTSGYGIHPALLDAALHPLAAMFSDDAEPDTLRLPFVFTGVSLHATGATALQIRLARTGTETFRLDAVDPAGAPVITIEAVTLRALPDTLDLTSPPGAGTRDSLFQLDWVPLPENMYPASADAAAAAAAWAVCTEHPDHLPAALHTSARHSDLATLSPCPPLVIWPLPDPAGDGDGEGVARVHTLTAHALTQLQRWLARPDTLDTHLVVVTRHGVSTSSYDRAPELAQAAVWALIHTTQNEHPGRISALDIDTTSDHTLLNVLAAAADPGRRGALEPQLALRQGVVHIPRLTGTRALTPPPTPHWELASTGTGDLATLALAPSDSGAAALGPGQIRVRIRAAGLNFRDVVVALGVIADEGLGAEAAGIVIDTAPDVTSLRPGDAVMGLFPHNAFATTAIAEESMVVPIPTGWSFAAAASVPVAFLTAYIALVEIGGLSAGQRVLIHAGAGGVGQAAIQIAAHLGAQVYATAHPHKHPVLRGLGVAEQRIASSRSLDFAAAFHQASGGAGMDVVLNSLSGDFIDTSLQLLAPGGRFLEIGKTDIRSAAEITATHPGVAYHVYDLGGEPPEQLQRVWTVLLEWFTTGALQPLPTTSYGLTQAIQAFRDMSQARHTGKIVLTPPRVFDPDATVLITGGTGMLGGVFAEHLITRYGVRHLLLVSRRGPTAPGATDLAHRLTALGAQVTLTAADTADPTQLGAVLQSIPTAHRLTAVVHTAGVLDDAVVTELTGQQLHTVLTAKADTAWHLHHLTADTDLAAFVLFSSAAAILGNPGQANYAAANAVLDALAQHRHRHHLPATSLAWGYWHTPSAMTAHLQAADQARLTATGMTPISTDHGRALFDTALTHHQPCLIPAPLNTATLTRQARQATLPVILSALTTTRPRAATAGPDTLTAQLATQTIEQRLATLTALVTHTTAAVLAHPDPGALDPDRPFKDLGIDSLSALELRNTLSTQTGLTLPATLVFDHPTPTAIATHLAVLAHRRHRHPGPDWSATSSCI